MVELADPNHDDVAPSCGLFARMKSSRWADPFLLAFVTVDVAEAIPLLEMRPIALRCIRPALVVGAPRA